MKITETAVRRIEIDGVAGLDPIRVMLEDIGPGQGRINIEHQNRSWASYWSAMGRSISQFFCACSPDYLAGKLSDIPPAIIDTDATVIEVRQRIITARRAGEIDREEARALYDEAGHLTGMTTPLEHFEILARAYGDYWWSDLPEKEHPEYSRLCLIIKTIQAALKELSHA